AYDANNAPVPGVQYDWEGEDVASGQIIDIPHKGKFASSKQGNYKIKIKMAAHEASAKVKVQGVRHAPGEKPVSPAKPVSSHALPPANPKPSSLAPRTKQRVARPALPSPSIGGLGKSFVSKRAAASLTPIIPESNERRATPPTPAAMF